MMNERIYQNEEEKKVLHFYRYNRTKAENVDFYEKLFFLFFVNLYEEYQVYEGMDLVEIKTKDARDFYIRVPMDEIPPEYYALAQIENGDALYDLCKWEYELLSEHSRTNDITFCTFTK